MSSAPTGIRRVAWSSWSATATAQFRIQVNDMQLAQTGTVVAAVQEVISSTKENPRR